MVTLVPYFQLEILIWKMRNHAEFPDTGLHLPATTAVVPGVQAAWTVPIVSFGILLRQTSFVTLKLSLSARGFIILYITPPPQFDLFHCLFSISLLWNVIYMRGGVAICYCLWLHIWDSQKYFWENEYQGFIFSSWNYPLCGVSLVFLQGKYQSLNHFNIYKSFLLLTKEMSGQAK